MKIGIVTQPLWGNYGGLMQNWALQQALRRMGHEPVTIDYYWNIRWPRYLISTLKTAVLWFVPGRRRVFAKKYPKRSNPKTDAFVKEHIARTPYVYSYRQSILQRYGIEAVITGSDQVWRPRYNPDLPDMYLDFVRRPGIRKVAYAASFGTAEKEYSEKNLKKCCRPARLLDAVSVREDSGITLCEDYFGIKATTALDPTLLLNKEDYKNLTGAIPECKDKYLAAYILDDGRDFDNVLDAVGMQEGLSMVRRVSENDQSMPPMNWIAMFRDASFVVTNSYHGTVFSIIFKKPFIAIYNPERGGDRFHSLLNPLGLGNRLLPDIRNIGDIKNLAGSTIDWTQVEASLNMRREDSLDFLRRNLI